MLSTTKKNDFSFISQLGKLEATSMTSVLLGSSVVT